MQYSFDASKVDPTQGVQVWPDNEWVKVVLEGNKPVPLKSDEKQGRLLWTLRAVDGPLAGKMQFYGMNLWITSDAGRAMAEGELSALTWVTLGANQGRLNFNNFDELHNIPFYILSRHGKNGTTTTQDWGGVKDINGIDPGKQGGGAAPAAAAPAFGAPAFGQPAAAPAAAPAFTPAGAPAAAPAFGQPAAAPAPAAFAPGFAPGAPPAVAAAPQFAAAPAAAPAFAPGGPAAAPGFAPPGGAPAPGAFAPPGQPAGSPPWANR